MQQRGHTGSSPMRPSAARSPMICPLRKNVLARRCGLEEARAAHALKPLGRDRHVYAFLCPCAAVLLRNLLPAALRDRVLYFSPKAVLVDKGHETKASS